MPQLSYWPNQALPIGDLSKYQQRKIWALNAFKIIGQAMKESANDLQENASEVQMKKTTNDWKDMEITPI